MTQSASGSLAKQAGNSSFGHKAAKSASFVWRMTKFAAVTIAASVFMLASPSFAQRGGGGGVSGGGGHAGGGPSGGGWSGGGSHTGGSAGSSGHSYGGSGHANSRGSRASGARGGPGGGRARSSSTPGKSTNPGHAGGFTAAVRHFFGLASAPKPHSVESANTELFSSSKLPPSLGRLQLAKVPAAFSTARPLVRPEIAAPPRPIWPHPRHGPYYPPYGYGYGCYGCDFGFGLGFGLGFGFPLFDFTYIDWDPGLFQRTAPSVTDMILYLDGSALEVADYWVEGDTLHYVDDDGKEGAVAVKDLDLQRTIDANQRLGLKFTLDRTQRGSPFEHVQQ